MPLVEIPHVLKTHQLGELGKVLQRRRDLDAGPVVLERLVNRLQRGPRRQKSGGGKNRDLVTDLFKPLCREHRRATAFDHIRDQRQIKAGAYFFHLLFGLRRLNKQDVGAGFGIRFGTAQRLVEAVRGARIGAGDD